MQHSLLSFERRTNIVCTFSGLEFSGWEKNKWNWKIVHLYSFYCLISDNYCLLLLRTLLYYTFSFATKRRWWKRKQQHCEIPFCFVLHFRLYFYFILQLIMRLLRLCVYMYACLQYISMFVHHNCAIVVVVILLL